ncbi:MAG: hypothetical protein PUK31_02785 [Candidatus Methanomethylophilaceae archaeon]|nr:hypothetical protein [Candidatus Methanomethylophilaceae archaeon]
MKHLFNISVYNSKEDMAQARSLIGKEGSGVDGLELLTGYDSVDTSLKSDTTSVHLPYATDWYGPAAGVVSVSPDIDPMYLRFHHYGSDRAGIVESIRKAIVCAEPLDPMYGVIHASSADMSSLLSKRTSYTDEKVLTTFADIMNEVVSTFPDGEPPFTLAFENTWWPGLRLVDDVGFGILEDSIEFDDWGICLDTGHILVSSGGSDDEKGALDILNSCADGYGDDLFDRLIAMHLHVNTSARIMANMEEIDSTGMSFNDIIIKASERIASVDQHRPFTDPAVVEYVERLEPEFVVHEIITRDMVDHIRSHVCQASFFR